MFKVDDSRNLVILALLVVVLVLAGCGEKKPPADDTSRASEEDVVDVIVSDQPLPGLEGFKDTLRGLGIVHMVLVDNTAKLRAIRIDDGAHIDLCESGTVGTCRLEIHSRKLVQELSRANNFLSDDDCKRCKDTFGTHRECHKKGDYKDMYLCHNHDKDEDDHYDCDDDC